MGRKRDPNKPKKTFWDRYKTYNPEVEGYGSKEQWKEAFRGRVKDGERSSGFFRTQKGKRTRKVPLTAREVIGVGNDASWAEIQKAFRAGVMKKHPDYGGSAEDFIEFMEAYELLKEEFGK